MALFANVIPKMEDAVESYRILTKIRTVVHSKRKKSNKDYVFVPLTDTEAKTICSFFKGFGPPPNVPLDRFCPVSCYLPGELIYKHEIGICDGVKIVTEPMDDEDLDGAIVDAL